MNIVKLVVVFAVMFAVLMWKKPLWMSSLAGAILTVLLWWMPLPTAAVLTWESLKDKSTLTLLFAIYIFSFIQNIMIRQGSLDRAEHGLSLMFNNRRVNAIAIPMVMGFMPTPGSVLLAAPVIDSACAGRFSKEDRAFMASYLRHIPESWLPTYTHIILAVELSLLPMSAFLLGMFPMCLVMIGAIYFLYIRKIDRDTGVKISKRQPGKGLWMLVTSLWPVLAIILLLLCGMELILASLLVTVVYVLVSRISFRQLPELLKSSFHFSMILGSAMVMVLKGLLNDTGAVGELVNGLLTLPIPMFLIFGLIYFIGSIVVGGQAIVAMTMPLVFGAGALVPGYGPAMLVFIMAMSHAGSQMSPTHICLSIIADNYDVPFGDLIRKTVPATLIYCTCAILYYLLWMLLGG